MFPSKEFDRLVQAGKLTGGLKISDLGRLLPVETMTADEITEVLARLEGVGIPVAIDAELEAPYHREPGSNSNAMPEPPSPSNAQAMAQARLEALASSIKDRGLQNRAPQQQRIKQSGTPFVVAAGLILIVLAVVAWSFGGA
jgi:hypothetical protein